MIANCLPPTSRPTTNRPIWLVAAAPAFVAAATTVVVAASAVARPALAGSSGDGMLLALLTNGAVAMATWHVLHRLGIAFAGIWALAVLALPGIALDARLLASAGLPSAAAVLLAVSTAIERRHRAMLGWTGVAVMLSPAALLLCPFATAMLIARRARWRIWLFALGIALLVSMGMAISNWHGDPSAATPLSLDHTNAAFRDAPDIWALASVVLGNAAPPLFGLAVASAIGAIASYLAWIGATGAWFRAEQVVSAALLALMLAAGLLPGMNGGGFLAAQILAVVLAAIDPRWRSIRLVVMTQIGACAAIVGHVGEAPLLTAMGALPMIAATFDLAARLIRPAANDNPLLPRAV